MSDTSSTARPDMHVWAPISDAMAVLNIPRYVFYDRLFCDALPVKPVRFPNGRWYVKRRDLLALTAD